MNTTTRLSKMVSGKLRMARSMQWNEDPASTAMGRRPLATGFTLVELLVVITIIGILIALLLPAVQAAREAARRMQCSNNLKQMGLAVLNYESSRNVLPPGAFFDDDASKGRGSILVHLLPYMEMQATFDAFDFRQKTDGQCYPGTTNPIGATPIAAYRCPSDTAPLTLDTSTYAGKVALHNYAASRGANELHSNTSCLCVNAWNGVAINGGLDYNSKSPFSGPFNRRGACLPLSEIRDGLSNTIFFGEVLPLSSWHESQGWATSNNGNGYVSTVIPINFDTSDHGTTGDPCRRYDNYNTADGFKSAHTGGAHFAFGDGSVHFLSETIDHQMYQYLGAKADGKPISKDVF
jgi:prepilin-type N-terminal cleavage/methylation domain-containing protein